MNMPDHVASPNYRISFTFLSVVLPGKTEEVAYDYARRLRMHHLSEADNPPEHKVIDPSS